MTTVAAVQAVLPPHRYTQAELTDAFADHCLGPGATAALMRRIHGNTKVQTRHLAVPVEKFLRLRTFTDTNNAFVTAATELGEAAVVGALEQAGIRADEVDAIFFTTVTGVAAPSIDARIAARVGLRPDVKRIPMFGLGCVAGAAGVGRVHDYLLGHPRDVAILLSVELCSLTLQRDDGSMANLVASGLFGDGAAALVALESERSAGHPGPQVIDSRSHLYPDSERTMGWDIGSWGLKIVLNAEVPALVRRYLAGDVASFLSAHDLQISDVDTWVSHPGGPKVIEAIEAELHLPADALELTWRSLAEVGNLSSASVLHVLADTLMKRNPAPNSTGVMMAMGPGFCSELVLLRW